MPQKFCYFYVVYVLYDVILGLIKTMYSILAGQYSSVLDEQVLANREEGSEEDIKQVSC